MDALEKFDSDVAMSFRVVNAKLWDYSHKISIESMAYLKARIYSEFLFALGSHQDSAKYRLVITNLVTLATREKLDASEQKILINHCVAAYSLMVDIND